MVSSHIISIYNDAATRIEVVAHDEVVARDEVAALLVFGAEVAPK